jgi:hypothetical protein
VVVVSPVVVEIVVESFGGNVVVWVVVGEVDVVPVVDVVVPVLVVVVVVVVVVVCAAQWSSSTPPIFPCGSQSLPWFGCGSSRHGLPELPCEHGSCPGGAGGLSAHAATANPAASKLAPRTSASSALFIPLALLPLGCVVELLPDRAALALLRPLLLRRGGVRDASGRLLGVPLASERLVLLPVLDLLPRHQEIQLLPKRTNAQSAAAIKNPASASLETVIASALPSPS